MLRVVLLLVYVIFLSGCSSNKDKDEQSKVAKLIDFDSTVEVKRLWTANTGEGKNRRYLRLVPAITNKAIYAADANGTVTALDLKTGKRLWRTETEYRVSGGLGAAPGLVIFGTLEGEVVALNAATGEKLWQSVASSEILAPPASNGSIVVAQTIDARVFTFDAKSGEVRWSYDHLSPVLSLRGTSAPIITSTQVICSFDNGQIVSFSAADGSRTWEARVSQPKGKTDLERIVDVDGTPVSSSGLVYAASYQGNVVALGRAQGNPIWKKSMSTYQPLSIANGKVFVSTENSHVLAYNSANGDVVWRNEALLNREVNGPALLGQYVAVIDRSDYVHILSQSDGVFAHRFKPKGDGFRAPMVSHLGRLYILSDDGKLSSYEVDPR